MTLYKVFYGFFFLINWLRTCITCCNRPSYDILYRIYSLITCMWKLKTIFWMRWNHWSFIFHLLAGDCVLLVSRFFKYLNHTLARERFWPLLISFEGDVKMCLSSTFKVLRNPFTILQGFFLQIFFSSFISLHVNLRNEFN